MEKYSNGYCFDLASKEDISGIIELENKYFEEDIVYKEEEIRKWISYNPNMIYVVRDSNNKVIAFTIIAPITEECYNKFRGGLITDMNEFEQSDIMVTLQSDYYYFADVVSDNKNPIASMIMFRNILPILWENTHYIVTTPVTDAGKNKAIKLGAKNTYGESTLKLEEPCYVEVSSSKPIAEKMVSAMNKILKKKNL